MKSETENELKKEAGAYYLAIERSQNLLAEYIVPNSGITDQQVISSLLGVLDDQNLVKQMRTGNEWIVYHSRKIRHEERCERERPRPEDFNDLNGGEAAYNSAYRAWSMMASCDAPNEPGYYRANND